MLITPDGKVKNGRCRMHGGASLSGPQHPRWKHGRYATTTFEGKMRRAEVQRRKRERARRKEDRYVYARLNRWVEKQLARRGWYNVTSALALVRRLRGEYRERQGIEAQAAQPRRARRGPEAQTPPVGSVAAAALREAAGIAPVSPAVEGLRAAFFAPPSPA